MPLMDYGIRLHHEKMVDLWGTLLSHFGLLVYNHVLYALSHMGKEPCDLFPLSSMIILLAVDVYHWFYRLL